jgi:hypothetical protein
LWAISSSLSGLFLFSADFVALSRKKKKEKNSQRRTEEKFKFFEFILQL